MNTDGGYSLEERLARLEVTALQNAANITSAQLAVERVDAKLGARPSWAIVFVIAFLQACVFALGTAVIFLATQS